MDVVRPIFLRQRALKLRLLPTGLCVVLLALCLLEPTAVPGALKPADRIERIVLSADPLRIEIHLHGPVPFKVVQVDTREVLIALRNLQHVDPVPQNGEAGPFLKSLSLAGLPHDVVGLTLKTAGPVKNVRAQWLEENRVLAVTLVGPEKSASLPPPAAPSEPLKKPPPVASAAPQGLPPPPPAGSKSRARAQDAAAAARFAPGTLDALLDEVATAGCAAGTEIQEGVRLCRADRCHEAAALLEQSLAALPSDAPGTWDVCAEAGLFLRAYCLFKTQASGDAIARLEAAQRFQDAINLFPQSRFLPYALTALGNTAMAFNNFEEARGYFKLVLDRYPDYRGAPEALLGLGRVYVEKKNHSAAVAAFRKIIDQYPGSEPVAEAKMGLGHTLYATNHLLEAIAVLSEIRTDSPRRVFDSPDLLVCLGNAYYQTGQLENACQTLAAAFNAFPDDGQNHILLTRIGDIYRDLGQTAKALPFYRLVRQRFPGTDGYLISSLREAEAIADGAEKEKIYRMIIAEYPDNPLSNLALVSLAEHFSRAGEDEKSIAAIRSFFDKYPRELNQEAAFIFQEAYRRVFDRLAAADDYPGILARFEADRVILKKVESPDLFYAVGKAYLQARLYRQAAGALGTAHDLYLSNRRPPELAFEFGAALQAAGNPARALPLLEAFLQKTPDAPHAAEASYRCGQILTADKAYGRALTRFQTALARAPGQHDRGLALMGMAEAYRGLKRLQPAAQSLVKAINHLAGASDNPYETLFTAYRRLGEVYLELGALDKAADALAMALKFTDQPQKYPDLRFLLGETYQRGAAAEQARLAFREVAASDDPFWARLAEEALRQLAIEKKLPQDA
jgi:TolA-binding protein